MYNYLSCTQAHTHNTRTVMQAHHSTYTNDYITVPHVDSINIVVGMTTHMHVVYINCCTTAQYPNISAVLALLHMGEVHL